MKFELIVTDGKRTLVFENGERRTLDNDHVADILYAEIERLRADIKTLTEPDCGHPQCGACRRRRINALQISPNSDSGKDQGDG